MYTCQVHIYMETYGAVSQAQGQTLSSFFK